MCRLGLRSRAIYQHDLELRPPPCIIYVPRGGDSLTELLPAQKGAPRSSPPAVGVAPLGNASVPGVSVLDSF